MRAVSGIDHVKALKHVNSGKAWGMNKVIGNLPSNRMGRRIAKKIMQKTTK